MHKNPLLHVHFVHDQVHYYVNAPFHSQLRENRVVFHIDERKQMPYRKRLAECMDIWVTIEVGPSGLPPKPWIVMNGKSIGIPSKVFRCELHRGESPGMQVVSHPAAF